MSNIIVSDIFKDIDGKVAKLILTNSHLHILLKTLNKMNRAKEVEPHYSNLFNFLKRNTKTLCIEMQSIYSDPVYVEKWDLFINEFTSTLASTGLSDFILSTETKTQNNTFDEKSITIYTDGSCSGNGRGLIASGGYSAYVHELKKVIYGKVPPVILDNTIIYPSNQRAECIGIIKGLEYATTLNTDITIITDSMFWKNMIETYMPGWEQKGKGFDTCKNPDLVAILYSLVKTIKATHTLTIVHVASHGKNANAPPAHVEGNNIADIYANNGRKMATFDTVIIDITY